MTGNPDDANLSPVVGPGMVAPAPVNTQVIPSRVISSGVERAFANLKPEEQDAVAHARGVVSGSGTPAPAMVSSEPRVVGPPISNTGARMSDGLVNRTGSVIDGTPSVGSPSVAPINASAPSTPSVSAPSVGPPAFGGLSVSLPPPSIQPTPGETELARLQKNGAGYKAIQNPFLRDVAGVADTVGSIIAPKWAAHIPGSTLNNERLQGNAEKEATEEQGARKSAADVAHTQSQTGLEAAQAANEPAHGQLESSQADEAAARAESIRNPSKVLTPKDKYIPVGDGVFNAESGDWAKEPTDKKLAEVTEVDATKGKALGLVPNKDGKILIPNAALNEFLKPTPAEKPSDQEKFVQSYLKEHALEDNATNRATALKAHATAAQSPERPLQTLVINPSGVAETVRSGSTVAPGSHSVSGVNQESTTADKKTQAKQEAASQAQDAYETAQELSKDQTGASDVGLTMQFIGAVKPESMGKIRFTPQEQNFVMGTRSSFGDLTAMAEKVANGQKLTPKQRDEMLRTMKIFADAAKRNANSSAGSATTPQRPTGVPENATFNSQTRQWSTP